MLLCNGSTTSHGMWWAADSAGLPIALGCRSGRVAISVGVEDGARVAYMPQKARVLEISGSIRFDGGGASFCPLCIVYDGRGDDKQRRMWYRPWMVHALTDGKKRNGLC